MIFTIAIVFMLSAPSYSKSIQDLPVSDDLSLILKTSSSLPIERKDGMTKELLADYVKNNPRDPLGHFYLARSYMDFIDFHKALQELGESLAIETDFADAHAMSASILYQIWIMETNRTATDTLALALKGARKAVELSPERPDFHALAGTLYDSSGLNGEAASEYTAAISQQPASVSYHLQLALALIKQKMFFSAQRNINMAMILCSKNNKLSPASRDDFVDLISKPLATINYEIQNSNRMVGKGRALLAQGNATAAEDEFNKAIAAASDNPDALVELGNLALSGDSAQDKAAAYFESAVARNPFNIQAGTAICNSIKDDETQSDQDVSANEKREACLKKVNTLKSFYPIYNSLWYGDDNANKLYIIGSGALQIGASTEAIAYLTAANILDPENADIAAALNAATSNENAYNEKTESGGDDTPAPATNGNQ